ncbi:MAG: PDZ domain-containing protein [Polyangiales bacterium]
MPRAIRAESRRLASTAAPVTEVAPAPTHTTPELIVDPAENGVVDAGAVDARAVVRARPTSRAIPGGGSITRRSGRWVVDLPAGASPRSILSGARLQQSMTEGGQGDGYRVTALDRHGLCALAGVRVGDVLEAVNGLPVRNPDEALEVLAVNRRATSFSVRMRRGGGRYTIPVDVRGARGGLAME